MADKIKEVRHMHKDYNTACCGIDISYVLATYEPDETTCPDCLDSRVFKVKANRGSR